MFSRPGSFPLYPICSFIYCYRIAWFPETVLHKNLWLWFCQNYTNFANKSILGAHLSQSQDCLAREKGKREGNVAFEICSSVSWSGKGLYLWICLDDSVELRAVRAPKAPATSVTWPLLGRWTLQVPQTSQGSYLCTLALELCAVRCYV